MNEHGFPLWKALVAMSLVVWGILSQIAPGRVSILAGCYNLAKLGAISPLIFQVLVSWRTPVSINIPISACVAAFVVLMDGHFRVVRQKRNSTAIDAVQKGFRPDTSSLALSYYLFLLGSGGHTKEMCSMIQRQFPPSPNTHRRYVITSGDNYSAGVLTQLEQSIKRQFGSEAAGTYDAFMVRRSRRVHQKWLSAIWSTVASTASLLLSLTTAPQQVRPGTQWPLPQVIVTNGPGTGFVLCVLAHLLKILHMAPPQALKIVYVESLARVKTLSLTGKLFEMTNIADVFIVQHPSLAKKHVKIFGGFMVDIRPSDAKSAR